MANTVEICNLSLGWLAVSLITSLDDNSTQANLCKVNFPLLRDAVLEARAWTFATKRTTLPPVTNGIPAEEDFGYVNRFKLPDDHIRVLKAGASPNFQDRLYWVKEKNEILANTPKLYLSYIYRIEDTSKFSSAFVQTLAARIASDLCVSLTENVKLQDAMWKKYGQKLLEAAATDGMQGRQEKIRSDALIIPRYAGAIGFSPYAGPYV